MLVRLKVPFIDTSAAALSWQVATAPAPLEPLGRLVVALPDGELELQVLGGSHQVAISTRLVVLSELVACAGRGAPLPRWAEAEVAACDYRLTTSVQRMDPAALRRESTRLRERFAADPRALVGSFPGSPDALTAIAAAPARHRELGWATWHVYPQTGEVVTTCTEVGLP